MNIYEVLGGSFVVFFTCVGLYTVGRFTYEGLKACGDQIFLGRMFEDQAVRDSLGEKLTTATKSGKAFLMTDDEIQRFFEGSQ